MRRAQIGRSALSASQFYSQSFYRHFLSSLFIVTVLSSLFEKSYDNVVLSGSKDCVNVGSAQFWSCQTRYMFGIPLPAHSPISIIFSILSIVPFLGSRGFGYDRHRQKLSRLRRLRRLRHHHQLHSRHRFQLRERRQRDQLGVSQDNPRFDKEHRIVYRQKIHRLKHRVRSGVTFFV